MRGEMPKETGRKIVILSSKNLRNLRKLMVLCGEVGEVMAYYFDPTSEKPTSREQRQHVKLLTKFNDIVAQVDDFVSSAHDEM
jgi:hypothetical protein